MEACPRLQPHQSCQAGGRHAAHRAVLHRPGAAAGADRPGTAAQYDQSHLDRLRLIKRLQTQHLPLAEIRASSTSSTTTRSPPWRPRSKSSRPREVTSQPRQSALDYIRGVLGVPPTPGWPNRRVHGSSGSPSSWLAGRAAPASGEPQAPTSTPAHMAARSPGAMPDDDGTPPWLKPLAPKPRPPGSERSTWERIVLAPDIELHVRRPLAPAIDQAARPAAGRRPKAAPGRIVPSPKPIADRPVPGSDRHHEPKEDPR